MTSFPTAGDPLAAHNRDERAKVYGVVVGIVTDNVHPDGDYAVRVRFPWLPGSDQSWWARLATFMSGKERGAFWLPEIDDEVLVAFEHGDFDHPIVIGSLWNGVDKAIYSNKDASGSCTKAGFQGKNEAKKNDLRVVSSRLNHQLIFNDNKSEPRVALHSSQKHRIVLDDKGNEPCKIEIYDGKEENYILIDTKNKKITVEAKTGDILIKAKKTIRLECETLETKSDKETNMKVGSNFKMESGSNAVVKAGGSANIEASGSMTIKGSTVNIN